VISNVVRYSDVLISGLKPVISNVVRYSDVLISGLTTCTGVLMLIGGITVKKRYYNVE
jgi:hypothetical protein